VSCDLLAVLHFGLTVSVAKAKLHGFSFAIRIYLPLASYTKDPWWTIFKFHVYVVCLIVHMHDHVAHYKIFHC
jgi:hypothetical protein